jgi:hypothetical protein
MLYNVSIAIWVNHDGAIRRWAHDNRFLGGATASSKEKRREHDQNA